MICYPEPFGKLVGIARVEPLEHVSVSFIVRPIPAAMLRYVFFEFLLEC